MKAERFNPELELFVMVFAVSPKNAAKIQHFNIIITINSEKFPQYIQL